MAIPRDTPPLVLKPTSHVGEYSHRWAPVVASSAKTLFAPVSTYMTPPYSSALPSAPHEDAVAHEPFRCVDQEDANVETLLVVIWFKDE